MTQKENAHMDSKDKRLDRIELNALQYDFHSG